MAVLSTAGEPVHSHTMSAFLGHAGVDRSASELCGQALHREAEQVLVMGRQRRARFQLADS
jgi:hypothetical protein